MMELRFVGDLAWWQGLLLAAIVAAGAWWVYRRETRRGVVGSLRWLLPLLRASAVLLVLLMLTGPVLKHREIVGRLSRVLVFLDASASMSVADPQMSVERRLLSAMRTGLLSSDALDTRPLQAAERLAGARTALAPLHAASVSTETLGQVARSFAEQARGAGEPTLANRAEKIAARNLSDSRSLAAARDELLALASDTALAQRKHSEAFTAAANRLAQSGGRSVELALATFERQSRWDRLSSALLGNPGGLLDRLAAHHEVQVLALDGPVATPLWASADARGLPDALPLRGSAVTNLADPLKPGVAGETKIAEGQAPTRTAAVLLTDGQHNAGASPLALAHLLGARGVPLYSVGFGSERAPADLAVVRVEGPASVHLEDRVRGNVTISDRLPGAFPFTLRIEHEGAVLFEQKLVTNGAGPRQVPFDFLIAGAVRKALAATDRDVRTLSLPMSLRVSVSPLEGETRRDNNEAMLHVRAMTHEPRVLLLDGRARWETRYLKNLFERDPRWKLTTIIAGPSADHDQIRHGASAGEFPADRRLLMSYDLIVLGELVSGLLKPEEIGWLRDFVQARGGGLILIDGQRGKLREYARSPLADLIPVRWEAGAATRPIHLEPAALAASRPALSLTAEIGKNSETWRARPAPHWVAPVTVAPGGGEVLVEGVTESRRVPVIVARRVGAGSVLYVGTDELWRWRYEVGDVYYQRLWNQLAAAVMEPPYAASDQFVSLDVEGAVRRTGESADIRVRLRDAQGAPVVHATAEALLWREAQVVATVPLTADENEGGVFRGKTPPLPVGSYDVTVRVTGFPESQMKARTRLVVEDPPSPEMMELACNEELLTQMAAASGGVYLREERMDRLAELLKPLSSGQVIESETQLAHSYGWFAPIVGLLTVEWLLRKRAGML